MNNNSYLRKTISSSLGLVAPHRMGAGVDGHRPSLNRRQPIIDYSPPGSSAGNPLLQTRVELDPVKEDNPAARKALHAHVRAGPKDLPSVTAARVRFLHFHYIASSQGRVEYEHVNITRYARV